MLKYKLRFCPISPYLCDEGHFYARSNLQESNLKTPFACIKQSIYSLCGSIQQIWSVRHCQRV